MFPVLQIGPLAIQTPGLILIAGLWLSLSLAERYAPRFGLKPETLDSLVLTSLIGGLIGARLGYVIQYPAAFFGNPISILSLNPGLLDPWTGLAAALILAFIFGQRKQLPFWPTLDALTPGLAVLAVASGFSHLASGAAFGMPAEIPWAVTLWGAERHPSQVYEIMAAVIILALYWPEKGPFFKKIGTTPGLYFLFFMAASTTARLFLEAFRGDSRLILSGIRQDQAIAWLILAFVFWSIGRKLNASGQPVQDAAVDGA
jgi:phosphatidylglycerol---prolipoprotein diacylglyceryl transferase